MPRWSRYLAGALPGAGWALLALAAGVSRGGEHSRFAEWGAAIGVAAWPAWLTDERTLAGAAVLVAAFYVWFLRPTHGRPPRITRVELIESEQPQSFHLRVTVEVFDEPVTFRRDWVADVLSGDEIRAEGIQGVSAAITSAAHSWDRFDVKFPCGGRIPSRAALKGARYRIKGADTRGRSIAFP
jgi:hypothetical protein